MIKIVIADDHAIVRRGLKEIVAEEPDMQVAGEAQNCKELLRLLHQQGGEVLVLDLNMPGLDGLETLKEIRRNFPRLPVLILTAYAEELYAVRALKAGAAGYLNKESAPEELVQAIRQVLKGGKYISPAVAQQLAFALDLEGNKAPHEMLSDREYQVLCLIASGKTVGEIADTLAISTKTVSTYRARILEKMQMKHNAELTHYAIHNGLVK